MKKKVLSKLDIKNIFLFITILFLWLLGGLIFPFNESFYSMLKLPTFILSKTLISYIWFILYILITISILKIINKTNIFKKSDYLYVLITNFLANQLFSYTFWYLLSPFFAFVMTSITFISSIFLFKETSVIKKEASYYLIPYMAFNIYAFITSLTIYIMNF